MGSLVTADSFLQIYVIVSFKEICSVFQPVALLTPS